MTISDFLRAVSDGEHSPAAWWFVALSALLGGAIGSFLNVVVYRLPLGMSLSNPGSHCPRCGHAVRWHDNVPVLGWIWLGGRCRDCGAPIAARYPLVEASFAAILGGFAWLEVVERGMNLPQRPALADDGDASYPYLLVARYAYHMLLMGMLLAAALIEHDGQRVPPRSWAPLLALSFAAAICWPLLRPAALPFAFEQHWQAAWQIGLVEGLCGLAAGSILGAVIFGIGSFRQAKAADAMAPASDGASAAAPTKAMVSAAAPLLAVVGSFLGLQAVCWVALGSVVWSASSRLLPRAGGSAARCCGGPIASVFVATLALLLAWRGPAALETRVGAQWLWLLPATAALCGRALFARMSPGRQ